MPSLNEELLEQGIRPKHWNSGNQKLPCPRCSPGRKIPKDPCLSMTITGESAVWNCHHCGWSGNGGKINSSSSAPLDADPRKKVWKAPAPVPGQYTSKFPDPVLKYLTGRGMTEEVLKNNHVVYETEKDFICFPFYETAGGKAVNIKKRGWKEKRFTQEAGAKQIFYGYDQVIGKKEIIIVEGEFDKLSLNVAGFDNVVSVPSGAPNQEVKEERSAKFEFLVYAEELLKKVDKVTIAVDSDNNGKILEKELARRIGLERCWIVKWPEGMKDANDVLVQMGVDMVCDCIQAAVPYPIQGLYTVEDFQSSIYDFYHNEMKKGVSTGFGNLDNFYTIMPGEVTVVTGTPNSGKSELLDAISVNLAKYNDWKFAIFSPENGKEQHVAKLCEKIMEQTLYHKSAARMSENDFVTGVCWVASRYYFLIADNVKELPTIDWILDKARIAVFRYGIKGLVIDPYNEIEHQRPTGMQETEYVSLLLTKLKRFAKANGVHIWIVAHPAKLQKDRDGLIQPPSGYDISGSANWVNKADCLVVVHRSQTPDITEVYIKKVRFKHVGKQGMCNLLYDRATGTYSVPQTEEQMETSPPKRSKKKKTESQTGMFEPELDGEDMETF